MGEPQPGSRPPAPRALVITGPTATGKTALSLRVAERLDAEIISMDSRQVYRGMDIGTAKATPEERRAVPHHGLDLVDPDERYSAGRFARDARVWIEEIRARGRIPILVGGTGFFLRALTHPMFREPDLDPLRRARLARYMKSLSSDDLLRWLEALDPEAARTLSKRGGRQRIERALEIVLMTGRPLGWWHEHAPPSVEPVPLRVFVLQLPRDELYRRIDQRVLDMIDAGLLQEVERLLEAGYDATDPGMSATGYIELIPVVQGRRSLEDGIQDIQRATRRYARRQMTWLRHQLPGDAIWLDATRPQDELVEEIIAYAHPEVGP